MARAEAPGAGGVMGHRTRAVSYILVAVIAFSIGGTTRASAESSGLPALVELVKALATGLAAEAARAIGAESKLGQAQDKLTEQYFLFGRAQHLFQEQFTTEHAVRERADADNAKAIADEAKARALFQQAQEHENAANGKRQAAQELWNKQQEALNRMHEEAAAAQSLRQAAHELADDAERLHQAEQLRSLAEQERALANRLDTQAHDLLGDAKFADAIKDIARDIAAQQVKQEAERASAAESKATALALLAAAKAAEAKAAALEKPVVVVNVTQLGGLVCVTAQGTGHTVLTIGPDGTITFVCVVDPPPQ